MKKKLLVLILAFAMTLAFAACGGGGGSEPAESTEPNAGVGGIVFAIPDGWTQTGVSVGTYSEFKNPDSAFSFMANTFTEEDLESVNKWDPSRGAESVEAYYEKNYNISEEELEKKNIEHSVVKVCDIDASYNKFKNEAGDYLELGTSWLNDGKIYNLTMYNADAYDENGKVKEGAATLTADDISMFEGVVASIQAGDGTAKQTESLSADSLGEIAFEAPAGFTITDLFENSVTFKKDGSSITLGISRTGSDELDNITYEDGSHPGSVKELYERYIYEGMDTTTIAGFDGHIDKNPYEDDKYYNVSASFMTEDAVYDIFMGSDAWDEEGNIKEDAETLSEDDLAAFDAFIASLKAK